MGRAVNVPAIAIEVMPYRKAPWAPKVAGCSFPWAYRVLRDGEQIVCAACDGTRRYAMRLAQQAAERMRRASRGAGNPLEYVI